MFNETQNYIDLEKDLQQNCFEHNRTCLESYVRWAMQRPGQ